MAVMNQSKYRWVGQQGLLKVVVTATEIRVTGRRQTEEDLVVPGCGSSRDKGHETGTRLTAKVLWES